MQPAEKGLLIVGALVAVAVCGSGFKSSPAVEAATKTHQEAPELTLAQRCKSGTYDMNNELGRSIARFCNMANKVPDQDPMEILNLEVQLYSSGDENVSDLAKWMYGRVHRKGS